MLIKAAEGSFVLGNLCVEADSDVSHIKVVGARSTEKENLIKFGGPCRKVFEDEMYRIFGDMGKMRTVVRSVRVTCEREVRSS